MQNKRAPTSAISKQLDAIMTAATAGHAVHRLIMASKVALLREARLTVRPLTVRPLTVVRALTRMHPANVARDEVVKGKCLASLRVRKVFRPMDAPLALDEGAATHKPPRAEPAAKRAVSLIFRHRYGHSRCSTSSATRQRRAVRHAEPQRRAEQRKRRGKPWRRPTTRRSPTRDAQRRRATTRGAAPPNNDAVHKQGAHPRDKTVVDHATDGNAQNTARAKPLRRAKRQKRRHSQGAIDHASISNTHARRPPTSRSAKRYSMRRRPTAQAREGGSTPRVEQLGSSAAHTSGTTTTRRAEDTRRRRRRRNTRAAAEAEGAREVDRHQETHHAQQAEDARRRRCKRNAQAVAEAERAGKDGRKRGDGHQETHHAQHCPAAAQTRTRAARGTSGTKAHAAEHEGKKDGARPRSSRTCSNTRHAVRKVRHSSPTTHSADLTLQDLLSLCEQTRPFLRPASPRMRFQEASTRKRGRRIQRRRSRSMAGRERAPPI